MSGAVLAVGVTFCLPAAGDLAFTSEKISVMGVGQLGNGVARGSNRDGVGLGTRAGYTTGPLVGQIPLHFGVAYDRLWRLGADAGGLETTYTTKRGYWGLRGELGADFGGSGAVLRAHAALGWGSAYAHTCWSNSQTGESGCRTESDDSVELDIGPTLLVRTGPLFVAGEFRWVASLKHGHFFDEGGVMFIGLGAGAAF